MLIHRNRQARNFGLRSRDPAKAARNALRERQCSFSTEATVSQRFAQFMTFVAQEYAIGDLRWVERAHVLAYGDALAQRVEEDALAIATAHNRLSAVNVVLAQARGDRRLAVRPGALLPPRSGIASEDRSHSPPLVALTQALLAAEPDGPRLSALIGLQQALGLRFQESAKANVVALQRQADATGRVTIEDGTKGGRIRRLPIVEDAQHEALAVAAALQGRDRSMIPAGCSYAFFQSQCYRTLARTPMAGFHGNRRAYAIRRFTALMGAPPPVVAQIPGGARYNRYLAGTLGIAVDEAVERLDAVQRQVAEEMGHARPRITRAYYG